MLRWMARRRLAAFERAFGYDTAYMREMLDASWSGFMRFAAVSKMARHRAGVPLDAWYAAKLTATVAEDCGPCTQLVVKMAEADGISTTVLRGILEGDDRAMGPDAALAQRFTRATLAHHPEADTLREQILARWEERGVVTLALVIAASRVFPTVKYAMGHGKTCSRIRIGDIETRPALAPIAA